MTNTVLPDMIRSSRLITCFSRRHDGNLSLSYGDTTQALTHRQDFFGRQGIGYKDLVCAKQIHAANVHLARAVDMGRGALLYEGALDNADAFVTQERNLPLVILTADCLSLFFHDPRHAAIGIAHAGWRGTQLEIGPRVLETMAREFDSAPGDIWVQLGPCIRPCCYEVSGDFVRHFAHGVTQRKDQWFFDLPAVNIQQLVAAGVPAEHIMDCGICTACQSDQYFSFRKEGDSAGRLASVIMLR